MTPNREQCIAWAREIYGVTSDFPGPAAKRLQRFAALAYQAGVAAERAKIAKELHDACDKDG